MMAIRAVPDTKSEKDKGTIENTDLNSSMQNPPEQPLL